MKWVKPGGLVDLSVNFTLKSQKSGKEQAAEAALAAMTREGRYVRDIWS